MAISKINSLALGSVAKVNSLLKASMAKINSLVNVLFSNDYSAVLDGTNDYITAHGVGPSINGASGSISIWFKLNTVGNSRRLYRFYVNSDNFISVFYHAYYNRLYAQHKGNGTITTAIWVHDSVENTGTFHHVVHTWNQSADQNKIYVDNATAVTSTGMSDFVDEEEGLQVYLGQSGTGGGYWDGNIDEVAIFDDVLTSGEVSTIYNSGTPTDISSHDHLIGYWRFENNTDDSSANSNAITLVNGASYDSGDVP